MSHRTTGMRRNWRKNRACVEFPEAGLDTVERFAQIHPRHSSLRSWRRTMPHSNGRLWREHGLQKGNVSPLWRISTGSRTYGWERDTGRRFGILQKANQGRRIVDLCTHGDRVPPCRSEADSQELL